MVKKYSIFIKVIENKIEQVNEIILRDGKMSGLYVKLVNFIFKIISI